MEVVLAHKSYTWPITNICLSEKSKLEIGCRCQLNSDISLLEKKSEGQLRGCTINKVQDLLVRDVEGELWKKILQNANSLQLDAILLFHRCTPDSKYLSESRTHQTQLRLAGILTQFANLYLSHARPEGKF